MATKKKAEQDFVVMLQTVRKNFHGLKRVKDMHIRLAAQEELEPTASAYFTDEEYETARTAYFEAHDYFQSVVTVAAASPRAPEVAAATRVEVAKLPPFSSQILE
ncbi:hypothetical protein KM043_013345 [Ampulex compressa]|nr:hypothetical protein KM043_013345 [Ampulex compressa]